MDKKWDRLEGVIGLSINIPKKYKVDFEMKLQSILKI